MQEFTNLVLNKKLFTKFKIWNFFLEENLELSGRIGIHGFIHIAKRSILAISFGSI